MNTCFCCVRLSFFCTKPRDWLGEYLQNDLFCVELNVKPQLSQSVWPTRGHNPNGISMGSAIFTHLMAECCRTSLGMSFPIKIAPSQGGSGPPSNTCFLGPTRVQNPNDISISSAVFAQLMSERHQACWGMPCSLKIATSHGLTWTPV